MIGKGGNKGAAAAGGQGKRGGVGGGAGGGVGGGGGMKKKEAVKSPPVNMLAAQQEKKRRAQEIAKAKQIEELKLRKQNRENQRMGFREFLNVAKGGGAGGGVERPREAVSPVPTDEEDALVRSEGTKREIKQHKIFLLLLLFSPLIFYCRHFLPLNFFSRLFDNLCT
jgi:hypothetical protein